MKKNVRKKLLSLIVCAALVFAMAVPAFASTASQPRYVWGQFNRWCEVTQAETDYLYTLNVCRSTPKPANFQKITLYEDDPLNPYWKEDQTFAVALSGKDGRPRFYSAAGYDANTCSGYCFNMNTSNYGVMLYYDQMDDYKDAEVDLWTKTYNGNVVCNITLPNRNNRCVTIRNYAQNEQLYWDAYSTGNVNQYWAER